MDYGRGGVCDKCVDDATDGDAERDAQAGYQRSDGARPFHDVHDESGPERPLLELGDGVPFAVDAPGGVPPAWWSTISRFCRTGLALRA